MKQTEYICMFVLIKVINQTIRMSIMLLASRWQNYYVIHVHKHYQASRILDTILLLIDKSQISFFKLCYRRTGTPCAKYDMQYTIHLTQVNAKVGYGSMRYALHRSRIGKRA